MQEDPELRPQHRHQADRGRGPGVQERGEDQVQGQVRTRRQQIHVATRGHFLHRQIQCVDTLDFLLLTQIHC